MCFMNTFAVYVRYLRVTTMTAVNVQIAAEIFFP